MVRPQPGLSDPPRSDTLIGHSQREQIHHRRTLVCRGALTRGRAQRSRLPLTPRRCIGIDEPIRLEQVAPVMPLPRMGGSDLACAER